MTTERFLGRRALQGLQHNLLVLMMGVTSFSVVACSYDYQALMGPSDGSAGGAGASRGTGGSPGSGGSVTTGSGGGSGTASGGASASGGATATGGAAATGGSRTGGTLGSGGMPATGSGGASSSGGASGTGGMNIGTGGAAGMAASGGASGMGGASVGGSAPGGASGGGTSGNAGAGGAVADPDLVLWYKFEETSGIAVADSSTAGAPHAGMLATFGTGGDAIFSAMHQVGSRSVALTSNGSSGGGYVILPTLQDLAPNAVTLAVWVQVTTAQRWQRVFDLGNTTTTNMALTTQDATDSVRFVIRVADAGPEQVINTTAKLTLSVWHHLVVVLRAGSPYTGEIFIDGVSAGTNAAMTFHAADLGVTVNNFLGRSQFTVDPYWSGLFDDFRVYRRALTAAEVSALMLQR